MQMDERRKSIRRPVKLDLVVWDMTTKLAMGRVENVSDEGVMLQCDRPLGPGAFFNCRLEGHEATGQTEETTFHAQSMWCRPKTGRDNWEVGFHVPDFTPHQLAVLRSLSRKSITTS